MVQYRLLAIGMLWGSATTMLLGAHKIAFGVAVLFGLPAWALFGVAARTRLTHRPFWIAVIISVLSSGIQYYQLKSLPIGAQPVAQKIRGTVVEVSRQSHGPERILLRLHAIDDQPVRFPWPVYASLAHYRGQFRGLPGWHGQFIVRWRKPTTKANPYSPDVWTLAYAKRVVAWGTIKSTEQLHETHSLAQTMRARLGQHFTQHFSEVTAGFLRAIILGERDKIPKSQRQALAQAGLGHLLAISGLHVAALSLVGVCLGWCFAPLGWRWGLPRQWFGYLFAVPLVWCYVMLAGLPISGVRAAAMLSLFVVLRMLSVHTELRDILLMVLALVLVLDPVAIFSPALWASYGAILLIDTALRICDGKRWTVRLLRVQSYLTLGLLPLMIHLSGGWTPMAFVLNLLVVPIFSVAFFPLLGMAMLTWHLFQWSDVLAFLDSSVVGLFELGAWGASVGYMPIYLGTAELALFVVAIGLLLAPRPLAHRSVGALAMTFVLLLWWFGAKWRPWSARLWLLDTGQSLSVVWQAQQNLLVYDVARSFASVRPLVTDAYYRQRWLVVSHDDIDHSGGLGDGFDWSWFQIRLSGQPEPIFAKYAVSFRPCAAGQVFQFGEARLDVLWPDVDLQSRSDNDFSCVIQLTYQGRRILLTGDIGKRVERRLAARGVLQSADVLIVPHHGSKLSSTELFLDKIRPTWSLIAASKTNPWGFPRQETLERLRAVGSHVLWTGADGAIVCEWDRDGQLTGCDRWRDRSPSSS
ncbi:MAG: DNA internalization-related competence protein ComEC/Rec2 [Gammaproteobacteria bacterium]|nr:MAG: DNA internalization-related competence protein ComEC/Rec2 [Gammaproteobacteria bacterium]